jgi:hypothetical protein
MLACMQAFLVLSSLEGNAHNLRDTILAFAIAGLIGAAALAFIRADHRSGWLLIPAAAMVMVLGTTSGANTLKDAVLQLVNLFFG